MADNFTTKDASDATITIAAKDVTSVYHPEPTLVDDAGVSLYIAHGSADSGKPPKIGAVATASLSGATMEAAADRTNLFAGIDGVLLVRPHCNLEDIVSGTAAITDGSSTSVIASQGAGIKVYVTSVVISNASATAAEVTIRDGAAGTVKLTLPVPADSGVVFNPPVPLPFSAATAVCADPDAALTTINVTIVGFKSKV